MRKENLYKLVNYHTGEVIKECAKTSELAELLVCPAQTVKVAARRGSKLLGEYKVYLIKEN